MLRTLVLAAAIAAPGVAMADPFPESALHAPVVADTGQQVGRVESVERNSRGQVVAIEAPGLEPPSAPHASQDLIAEQERARALLVRHYQRREGGARVTSAR